MNYSKLILFWLLLLAPFASSSQYLKVSDNGRFLVKDDGSPFFLMADTGWEMFHRLDRSDIDFYLKTRHEQGFNVIQCVILSEINGLTVPNREGNLPLVDLDPTKPNEAYFELVDYAVEKAAEYGMYLALLPTWGAHAEDKAHGLFENLNIFTVKNAKKYGQFLGKRYKNNWNVVWVLGGDRPAGDNMQLWNEMAAGLNTGNKNKQLIAYHPAGKQTSTTWFKDSDWLDFHICQTGHYQPGFPVYEWIEQDYQVQPTKPVLNGEPAYEDIGIWFNPINGRYDAFQIRTYAYWSVFAGAFGHTYGNNNLWQMYREEYKGIIAPNMTWDKALDRPGANQMKYLRQLMESRPFTSRIPDQSLILKDRKKHIEPKSTDHVRVTRDGTPNNKDATYIMAYLPYHKNVEFETSVIPGSKLNVSWYDPRTGKTVSTETIPNTGFLSHTAWSGKVKPADGGPDWVLVIDDAEKGYVMPRQ